MERERTERWRKEREPNGGGKRKTRRVSKRERRERCRKWKGREVVERDERCWKEKDKRDVEKRNTGEVLEGEKREGCQKEKVERGDRKSKAGEVLERETRGGGRGNT